MDAHSPYLPPDPYSRRWFYEPSTGDFSTAYGWVRRRVAKDEGARKVLETERRHRLGQYDGEIAYLDTHIGILFEELRKLGAYDNSLIVLTSDHGEFFFEHNFFEHPGPPYQEVIRVPLIVKCPASKGEQPGRIPGSVSLIDLFHSILQYTGIPHKPRERAKNLFEGETSPVFSEFHLTRDEDVSDARKYGKHIYSLIRHNYKLIYSSKEIYEFYDLSSDPLEANNLISEDLPEDVKRVLAGTKAELASLIAQVNARKLVPVALETETREEIRSRLKALGYIH